MWRCPFLLRTTFRETVSTGTNAKTCLEYLQDSGSAPYVSPQSRPGHAWHRNKLCIEFYVQENYRSTPMKWC